MLIVYSSPSSPPPPDEAAAKATAAAGSDLLRSAGCLVCFASGGVGSGRCLGFDDLGGG